MLIPQAGPYSQNKSAVSKEYLPLPQVFISFLTLCLDQIDWFVFETRIRSILKEEYMKPMVERQKDWTSRFEAMQQQIDSSKKQVDDHDLRIMRIIKQTGQYEDLLKKIHDTDANRRALESRLNSEIQNIKIIAETNRSNH